MKKLKTIYSILAFIMAAPLLFMACKKDAKEEFNPRRLFMPGKITFTPAEKTVRLEWDPSLYQAGTDSTIKYTVEVSKDSTFATAALVTVVVDTPGVTFTNSQLEPRRKYFARIKANQRGTAGESLWLYSSAFAILGEQIFIPMLESDIIDRSVILKWTVTPGVTKLVLVQAPSGTPVDITLSPAELAAGQKQIDNLTPNTTYVAEIYAGTLNKGVVSFKTKALLAGASVIDLRGIANRPSVLADTLPQIAAGSIVILERGLTYTISSALSLSKPVTIMSGDAFNPALATISLISNFNIVAGSTIDSLIFKNVNLIADSYSAKYVFNINQACTIGKIVFDGCKAEVMRGMVRLQSAVINVTDFTINNCIVDSISNYGVVNVDHLNCKIENIAITNSTIYKAEKVVTSKQNSTSVTIRNCTINEAPWGGDGNYLVDYGALTVSQGIKINNCIMGIGKINGSGTSNLTVRGYRASASTAIEVTGTYNTADYKSTSNVLPNLIPYTGNSTDLFESPSTGNFKIKDASFAGKATAGDPRWKP